MEEVPMASKTEFCSVSSRGFSEAVQSMKAGMKPGRAIAAGQDVAKVDNGQGF